MSARTWNQILIALAAITSASLFWALFLTTSLIAFWAPITAAVATFVASAKTDVAAAREHAAKHRA